MAEPKTPEEWEARVEEIIAEIDQETVTKAYAGNAHAKAQIQALVIELQAAAVFLATYSGGIKATQDALLETVNTIIDTLQAILLAIGILYLLKRVKKRKKVSVEVTISAKEAAKIAGDKAKPRPSKQGTDKEKDADFLFLRLQWAAYFLQTLMKASQIHSGMGRKELVWHAKRDTKTCTICHAMDGERSVNGDFLPVLLKKFPDYKPYTKTMWWPHVHPRCRCWATVEGK